MRRILCVSFAFAGLAAAAACGSFGATATDASDAGPDAAPDAPPPDGGDDAPASGCGWEPFDDGFERADYLGTWDRNKGYGEQSGIFLTIDANRQKTGASSLSVEINAFNEQRGKAMERDLRGNAARGCVELSFELLVRTMPAELVTILTIETENAHVGVGINDGNLVVYGQNFDWQDAGNPTEVVARFAVSTGVWTKTELLFEEGSPPRLQLRLVGVERPVEPFTRPQIRPRSVVLGAAYVRQNTAAVYNIDDLSIR